MKNRIGSLGIAIAMVVLLGVVPSQAATYNWCPTASSGAINCTNCTVNLTCDLTGVGITIMGSRVVLNGQGHSITGTNRIGAGVVDRGYSTTVKNLYVYYTGMGIYSDGRGDQSQFTDFSGVGSYGSDWGYYFIPPVFSDNYWANITMVDSWAFGSRRGIWGSNSKRYLTFYNIQASYNNGGGASFTSGAPYVQFGKFLGNLGSGIEIDRAWALTVKDVVANENGGFGLSFYFNDQTTMERVSGHGNAWWDCSSVQGLTSASNTNDFGKATGYGCVTP